MAYPKATTIKHLLVSDHYEEEIYQKNVSHDIVNNKILNCSSMFLAPVTVDDVLNVASKLKGKFSAVYDEIA
jgi:hypothetical protein